MSSNKWIYSEKKQCLGTGNIFHFEFKIVNIDVIPKFFHNMIQRQIETLHTNKNLQ